jgi:preprotein translocase subunit SecE
MEQEQTASPGLVERMKNFVQDVRVEAGKISWPTRAELRDSSTVVIGTVILISIFIFIVDQILTAGLKLVFR